MSVVTIITITLADINKIVNAAAAAVSNPPPSMKALQKEYDDEFTKRLERWSEQQV